MFSVCLPLVALYYFRYEGPLSEEGVLEKAVNEGPRSIQYTQLVEWITKELKEFTGLEDYVSAINGMFVSHCWRKSFVV